MSIFSRVPTKPTGSMRKRFKPVNTTSFNFGGIYPILCKNVMPGDSWRMNLSSFVRTVPLISPVMHRNDIKVDAFFVPYRLIWKSSEEWFACNDAIKRPKFFIQAGANYSVFYDPLLGPGSIHDYFNFGTPSFADLTANSINQEDRQVDIMPLRAYRMIYDFYFRNKAVEDDITTIFPDFYGDNDFAVENKVYPDGTLHQPGDYLDKLVLQFRPWRRDIFTSALPDPQNGPDVVIPQADIEADGTFNLKDNTNTPVDGDVVTNQSISPGTLFKVSGSPGIQDIAQSYNEGLKLGDVPTMRTLRAANLMEEFEEAMARIGYSDRTLNTGKFKEWLRGIWNVRSSDGRLDIPEWLGGYRGPITISEIPQTSGSTANSPQGNLAGKGVSAGGSRIFKKKFFEEPGVMMVLMSIVPKSAYCQGDPREWLYESGFDYPNPYFEGLGEQEVKSKEINCLADLLGVQNTFGYNVRNYEMKTYPDEIHGKFRTDLAYWHEGRMFPWSNVPGLNKDFLKVKPADVSRIFPSTETSDKLLGQFFFDIEIKRRLNPYGLPSFTNF